MRKRFSLTIAFVSMMVVAGVTSGALLPNFQYIISYDGYLQQRVDATGAKLVFTDTLIVVNNASPGAFMGLHIEVFDKHGELISEGPLWNGGKPVEEIAPNGYGWITLGMAVDQTTQDPFGTAVGGEKFHIRISANHLQGGPRIVPTVEIKQVIYVQSVESPEKAIWEPGLFRTWTETALGGNRYATGVIFAQ
ncbi:MAG: hypothetical protein U9Q81_26200 [Pseudomonadota bacterium]|nr:hypothetical protein [Pseudomonadota bacterium]